MYRSVTSLWLNTESQNTINLIILRIVAVVDTDEQ